MGSSYHYGGKEPILRFSQASKYVQHMYLWKFMLYSYRHEHFFLICIVEPKRGDHFKLQTAIKTASEGKRPLLIDDMVGVGQVGNYKYSTRAYLRQHIFNRRTTPTRSIETLSA
jgi:hypothetical protein